MSARVLTGDVRTVLPVHPELTPTRRHVVMFSGGAGSWAAAKRVAEQHGTAGLTLLFTDTLIEDADLYRFLVEAAADVFRCAGQLDGLLQLAAQTPTAIEARRPHLARVRQQASAIMPGLVWIADGRTPWDVFRDSRFLGNTRVDLCSRVLKRELSETWLRANRDPADTTLVVGIDWTEEHRYTRMRDRWAATGWTVEAPLCDAPYLDKTAILAWLGRLGIAAPRLYALGFSHNNCFHGDTRFITDEGIRTLRECVGQRVRVLGTGGGWKDATVQHFGEQELVELVVERFGIKKRILTTADHRWFIRTGRTHRRERLTHGLGVGDRLFSMHAKLIHNVRPSAFGIAHGIVFGDGTRDNTQWNGPARVMLCGEKDAQLLRWFPLSPRQEVPGVGIEVRDLPRAWRQAPDLSESQSYLYGWLAGYFAADGSATGGEYRLASAKRANLQLVRDVCARIGVSTSPIRMEMRRGYGQEDAALYTVTLHPSTLREDFFLVDAHRQRFADTSHIRPAEWAVVEVRPTGQIEEVFCAVVADGHAFALEDNILTGNCGGGCVKAGLGHFAHLLRTLPDVYAAWEREEAALAADLGKPVTILRDRTGGATRPLTLGQLRERIEAGHQPDLFDIGGCGCFVDDPAEAA